MAFDYEVLRAAQHVALVREHEYAHIPADFGDGFYGGATIGDALGLYRWTLTWNDRHRDLPTVTGRTYLNVTVGSAVPIPQYLEEFFYRRMVGSVTGSANEPFWFRDVDHLSIGSRVTSVCRMLDTKITRRQDGKNPLLYSYSIRFQQVRGYVAQSA
jgi:hypothetical protein